MLEMMEKGTMLAETERSRKERLEIEHHAIRGIDWASSARAVGISAK